MYMEKSLNLGRGLIGWGASLFCCSATLWCRGRRGPNPCTFPSGMQTCWKSQHCACKWFLLVTMISCFATPNIIIPFSNNGDLDLAWSKALLQMSVPGSVVEPSSTFDAADNWNYEHENKVVDTDEHYFEKQKERGKKVGWKWKRKGWTKLWKDKVCLSPLSLLPYTLPHSTACWWQSPATPFDLNLWWVKLRIVCGYTQRFNKSASNRKWKLNKRKRIQN